MSENKKPMVCLRNEKEQYKARIDRLKPIQGRMIDRAAKAKARYDSARNDLDKLNERIWNLSEHIAGLNGLLSYEEQGAVAFQKYEVDGTTAIRFYDKNGNQLVHKGPE